MQARGRTGTTPTGCSSPCSAAAEARDEPGQGARRRWRLGSTASRSTRSFIGSPQWPLTHRNATSPRSVTSVDQRLPEVAVGDRLLRELVQPRASQPSPPAVAEAVDDVGRVGDDQQRARRGPAPPPAPPGSPSAGWWCGPRRRCRGRPSGDGPRPAAGSGVPRAGAVGVDRVERPARRSSTRRDLVESAARGERPVGRAAAVQVGPVVEAESLEQPRLNRLGARLVHPGTALAPGRHDLVADADRTGARAARRRIPGLHRTTVPSAAARTAPRVGSCRSRRRSCRPTSPTSSASSAPSRTPTGRTSTSWTTTSCRTSPSGCRSSRRWSRCRPIPVDCHLMIDDPDRWAPGYAEAGAKSVTFHVEAVSDAVAHGPRDPRGRRPGRHSRSSRARRSRRTPTCCPRSTWCSS